MSLQRLRQRVASSSSSSTGSSKKRSRSALEVASVIRDALQKFIDGSDQATPVTAPIPALPTPPTDPTAYVDLRNTGKRFRLEMLHCGIIAKMRADAPKLQKVSRRRTEAGIAREAERVQTQRVVDRLSVLTNYMRYLYLHRDYRPNCMEDIDPLNGEALMTAFFDILQSNYTGERYLISRQWSDIFESLLKLGANTSVLTTSGLPIVVASAFQFEGQGLQALLTRVSRGLNLADRGPVDKRCLTEVCTPALAPMVRLAWTEMEKYYSEVRAALAIHVSPSDLLTLIVDHYLLAPDWMSMIPAMNHRLAIMATTAPEKTAVPVAPAAPASTLDNSDLDSGDDEDILDEE